MDISLILGLLRVDSGTGEDQGLGDNNVNTKQTNYLLAKGKWHETNSMSSKPIISLWITTVTLS